MNKSYLSLSILIFAFLYIPISLGMEHKSNIFSLHQETIKTIQAEDATNLRLTCKLFAQKCAKNPNKWSLMPDHIENQYNKLSHYDKETKKEKTELILAHFARKDNPKAIQWITSNIELTGKSTLTSITSPLAFAYKNENMETCKILFQSESKSLGLIEESSNLWSRIHHFGSYNNNLQSFLPLQQQNSAFFPDYILAAKFDNVPHLKELLSQAELTSRGIVYLLMTSSVYGPDCFKFLLNKYKNDASVTDWYDNFAHREIYSQKDIACKDVRNYLEEQKIENYSFFSLIF